MQSSPYIFIFDIDGTLIGDITPQVMMYDIVQELKRKGKMSFDKKDLMSKLKNGIFRPHFHEFMNQITSHYGIVEMFVYTASQKKWANFLIPIIEKTFDIKFNRPIFTRDDCANINYEYIKNISKIKPRILKTLKKKYPDLTLSHLKDRIMMIDNNQVFTEKDRDKVIICPTYSFRYPENIPSKIKNDTYEKFSKPIYNAIERYIKDFPFTSKYLRFERFFYQNYIQDLTRIKDAKEDKFWINLAKILTRKNIIDFDERSIRYVNKKLQDVAQNKI